MAKAGKNRVLVPRNLIETSARLKAAEKPLFLFKFRGKAIPAFNGSQNNRRNKKRPITLPERA